MIFQYYGLDATSVPGIPDVRFSVSSFDPIPVVFGLLAVGIVVGAAMVALNLLRAKLRRQNATFKSVTMLVTVPKSVAGQAETGEGTKERVQEAIAAAEAFFSNLGGLKPQKGWKVWLYGRTDEMALEIVCLKKVIKFYVTVPRSSQTFIEQAISAAWSDANVEPVEDFNIFSPTGVVVGAHVKLARLSAFPIKTYRKQDKDPLNAITQSVAKLPETEGAAFQFLIRPTANDWRKRGIKIAANMKKGMTMSEAMTGKRKSKAGVAELTGMKQFKEAEEHRLSPLDEQAMQGLEEKASKAGLEVCARIVACGDSAESAQSSLASMLNAFAPYNVYEYGNSFAKDVPRSKARMLSSFVHREFDDNRTFVLNAEELASVWHLPTPWSETPNIQWLLARRVPAPANIPRPEEGHVQLGNNVYRGVHTPIWVKEADRRRHMYIIGKSGSGKTEMMKAMVQQDIEAGRGVCVIDPHGDFADDALTFVPKERADDVIFFDPSDFDRPMGLNMLEYDPAHPEQKTFVINEMLKIFDKLYDLKSTGGPMFELYMRNAILLLMAHPESGSTLMEIPRVLADEDYRAFKLSKCTDQNVKDFWEKEATKAGGEASLANMVPYITSKLTPFIYNDYMKPIIGQQQSAFTLRDVMDGKKILLLKLSKGKIGDLNAYLIGMVLVGKILMAALSRGDLAAADRKDFYLYIDEFQNFLTDSISSILSEARKYGLDLIIAHQFVGQLEGKGGDNVIRDAIFGNVGSMFINRVGVEDAEFLAKEMAPTFTQYDLVNVESFTFNAKILIDNQASKPFNFRPLQARKPSDKGLAEQVRELSRLRFGRDREIVMEEIALRTKNVVPAA